MNKLRRTMRSAPLMKAGKRVGFASLVLAVAAGLGIVSMAPSQADGAQQSRKHTGDLVVKAVCNTKTGNYDLTATLTLTRVPAGQTGSTMWRIGTSNFEGTPDSANGMDRGPISSNGNTTLTLGTWSLPGTTKGLGPWVYAYTKWSPDNYGKGSDGRLTQELKGDCTPPAANCEKSSPTYVWGPNVVSVTGGKPGNWLSLWDAQDQARQHLISKIQVGADCTATQAVPPADCEPHQYQGDYTSTEPPATITDTSGDGVADVPGYIAGELFTVPGDDSQCGTPPPTDACPELPGDQPRGFQCEPKTQKQTRHIEKGPNCKTGTSITKNQQRMRTQRFVNDQWKWGKWSKWKTVSSTAVTLPPGVCKAKVRAHCVTRHWGEGVAAFINKGSDTSKRFHIVRSGKDRYVKVGAHKSKRVELRGLRVGSIVKVKADGKVLARAHVKGGCGHTPPPDTGARQAAG